jgi:hypothetical protein
VFTCAIDGIPALSNTKRYAAKWRGLVERNRDMGRGPTWTLPFMGMKRVCPDTWKLSTIIFILRLKQPVMN